MFDFSLYLKHLGKFKKMTASIHVLYCHGAEYLAWSQYEIGVPLGALAESAVECHNGDKKFAKFHQARQDTVEHQSEDSFHSVMWKSCPLIISFLELIQIRKRGCVQRRRRERAK